MALDPKIIWNSSRVAARTAGERGQATKMLRRAAGEFAGAVAAVLPAPHAAFFGADARRRRLIMALAVLSPRADGGFREALATASARRLVADYLPMAGPGFLGVLEKIVASAFSRKTLYALIPLLREDEAGKTLRHAERIDRELIVKLVRLPAILRRLAIVRGLTVAEADDIGRMLHNGVGATLDPDAMRALAQRLGRLRSGRDMVTAVAEATVVCHLPVPPAAWLLPLRTPRELRRAAVRFRNCLETRIEDLMSGQSVFYEVVGSEPAIVEVECFGDGVWRGGEIAGLRNQEISDAVLEQVSAYFADHGLCPPQR